MNSKETKILILTVWSTKNIAIVVLNSYIYMKHGAQMTNSFAVEMFLYFSINQIFR